MPRPSAVRLRAALSALVALVRLAASRLGRCASFVLLQAQDRRNPERHRAVDALVDDGGGVIVSVRRRSKNRRAPARRRKRYRRRIHRCGCSLGPLRAVGASWKSLFMNARTAAIETFSAEDISRRRERVYALRCAAECIKERAVRCIPLEWGGRGAKRRNNSGCGNKREPGVGGRMRDASAGSDAMQKDR